MRIRDDLPSFEGPDVTWLGDASAALEPAPGTVLLVHFFAVSCDMCKTQLPRLVDWRDRTFAGKLRIIGVHMPRFPEDVDLPRVKTVVHEHRLTHPVAVDDQHTITNRFENEYVPSYFTFDADRKLIHKKAGEKALDFVEKAITRALGSASIG